MKYKTAVIGLAIVTTIAFAAGPALTGGAGGLAYYSQTGDADGAAGIMATGTVTGGAAGAAAGPKGAAAGAGVGTFVGSATAPLEVGTAGQAGGIYYSAVDDDDTPTHIRGMQGCVAGGTVGGAATWYTGPGAAAGVAGGCAVGK